MLLRINQALDRLSEFFAHRKGLLPLIGILLIIANLVFQFIPYLNILAEDNLLLHLGVILAIIGFMLAWAL